MQVLGYDSGAGTAGPSLSVAAAGAVTTLSLEPGSRLRYRVGRRHCVGTVEAGHHEPCEEPAAPRCPTHEDIWPCSRCIGDCDRPVEACHEPHVVYLAAFEPRTFKVGVTREWRIERRLREQGAARGAVITEVADGRIARSIEADWTSDIPDRVGLEAKIVALAAPLDADAWEALLETTTVVERHRFEYGLSLEHQPVQEQTLWGTVRGVRGRLLVLERSDGVVAVDMRGLVGADLEPTESPPPRQSSLGRFG